MADEQPNGADVAVDAFGVKANVRNVKSLNTMLTFLGVVLAILVAYMLFMHTSDAKDNAKEIASALKESNKEVANTLRESQKELGQILKELSQAAREQNCLLAMQPEKRAENVELCKRISR
jgi:uncharacterized membrane protein YgaE (UPF0421/DUF939 family)